MIDYADTILYINGRLYAATICILMVDYTATILYINARLCRYHFVYLWYIDDAATISMIKHALKNFKCMFCVIALNYS